jgi:hypothetical protein
MSTSNVGTLKILVPDIQGWAIVKHQFSVTGTSIHGEHLIGCKHAFDRLIARWCWEWSDAGVENTDRCWVCKEPVPEEIVALVAMMNWEKIQRGKP